MITHIVTFKLNDAASDAVACKAMLDGLLGKVPSLRSMLVGVNVVESARAHDLGLIATFDDLEGLAAYQVHSDHVEVATHLRSVSSAIVALDFESD